MEEGRGPYSFHRSSPVATDSLPRNGYGNPRRPCGLIYSGFRPSDDACIFPLLVPSNFFAVTRSGSWARFTPRGGVQPASA